MWLWLGGYMCSLFGTRQPTAEFPKNQNSRFPRSSHSATLTFSPSSLLWRGRRGLHLCIKYSRIKWGCWGPHHSSLSFLTRHSWNGMDYASVVRKFCVKTGRMYMFLLLRTIEGEKRERRREKPTGECVFFLVYARFSGTVEGKFVREERKGGRIGLEEKSVLPPSSDDRLRVLFVGLSNKPRYQEEPIFFLEQRG